MVVAYPLIHSHGSDVTGDDVAVVSATEKTGFIPDGERQTRSRDIRQQPHRILSEAWRWMQLEHHITQCTSLDL